MCWLCCVGSILVLLCILCVCVCVCAFSLSNGRLVFSFFWQPYPSAAGSSQPASFIVCPLHNCLHWGELFPLPLHSLGIVFVLLLLLLLLCVRSIEGSLLPVLLNSLLNECCLSPSDAFNSIQLTLAFIQKLSPSEADGFKLRIYSCAAAGAAAVEQMCLSPFFFCLLSPSSSGHLPLLLLLICCFLFFPLLTILIRRHTGTHT